MSDWRNWKACVSVDGRHIGIYYFTKNSITALSRQIMIRIHRARSVEASVRWTIVFVWLVGLTGSSHTPDRFFFFLEGHAAQRQLDLAWPRDRAANLNTYIEWPYQLYANTRIVAMQSGLGVEIRDGKVLARDEIKVSKLCWRDIGWKRPVEVTRDRGHLQVSNVKTSERASGPSRRRELYRILRPGRGSFMSRRMVAKCSIHAGGRREVGNCWQSHLPIHAKFAPKVCRIAVLKPPYVKMQILMTLPKFSYSKINPFFLSPASAFVQRNSIVLSTWIQFRKSPSSFP